MFKSDINTKNMCYLPNRPESGLQEAWSLFHLFDVQHSTVVLYSIVHHSTVQYAIVPADGWWPSAKIHLGHFWLFFMF